jgi:hypothetical protein
MTRFLALAAGALVMSTAAYADNHTVTFSSDPFDSTANVNASDMLGMRVYASEASISSGMTIAAGDEAEWNDIGEINEILLTRDGKVQSVIVGVGGFLGIGEKDVAINMSEIRFVAEDGETDDFFLVIEATAVGVQDAPTYQVNQPTNTVGELNDGVDDQGIDVEAITDAASPPVDDAQPNPVVPQNAVIPPAPILDTPPE